MTAVTISLHPKCRRSEKLGEEITELYALITAASYELLVRPHNS